MPPLRYMADDHLEQRRGQCEGDAEHRDQQCCLCVEEPNSAAMAPRLPTTDNAPVACIKYVRLKDRSANAVGLEIASIA